MNRTMLSLKRFPIVTFCALTVLLSYASVLLPIPREALPFVFVLIPAAVAVVQVRLTEGRSGLRSLLGGPARWRVGAGWIAAALLLALAMRLAIAVIAQLMDLIPAIPFQPQNWAQVMVLGVIYLVAAVFEELGWRGYALRRMLDRHSALFSGLMLGIPWGVIHIALHLPGMWSEGLPWAPTVVQLVALSVVITWLFVRSGYSLLVAILFHAAQSFFGFLNEGIAPLHMTWLMAAVWSATAALAAVDLLALTRQRKPLAAA